MAKSKSRIRKPKTSRPKNSRRNKMDKSNLKEEMKKYPTLKLKDEKAIAMDFATKFFKKYDKLAKSVILFGSVAKNTETMGSDIDIIIIIDDVSIKWDQELIAWYREQLDKLLRTNPYRQDLHINTVKLSSWWEDLMRGDPVVLNILRYGEAMIDLAGFFDPLKSLLLQGKIRATPEAIYSALQRAPVHLARSKLAELGAIEGIYWSMVDSAHAALIAAKVPPASPEHVPIDLNQTFVNNKLLKQKYVGWYKDILMLHKKIVHGEVKRLRGIEIDELQDRADEFLGVMAQLVKDMVEK